MGLIGSTKSYELTRRLLRAIINCSVTDITSESQFNAIMVVLKVELDVVLSNFYALFI